MLSVEAAQERILERIQPLPTESLGLTDLIQESSRLRPRTLAKDLLAGDDIPPFTNTSMDGFAVQASATATASTEHPVSLPVVGVIAAGHPFAGTLRPHTAARIMTGAPIPDGADAVVQVEWTEEDAGRSNHVAVLRPVTAGQNLRFKGEDVAKGSRAVPAGTALTPPVLGFVATLGYTTVDVFRRPRVAIISTGDELVNPGEPLAPGKIRNSNAVALAAAVSRAGGIPSLLPTLPDDADAIRGGFRDAVAVSDVILSSGGVSVGDFDLVKTVLQEFGRLDFWRVNMKPGKPLAFGSLDAVPFFGLPGNPVSALVTFELFVRPVLSVLAGHRNWHRLSLRLPLQGGYHNPGESRRQYLRGTIVEGGAGLEFRVIGSQGSAIQTSWLGADALAVVPEDMGSVSDGALVDVLVLD